MLRILAIATVGLALSKVASTSLASASNAECALMVEGSDYAYYVDSGSITDLPNRALRFRILIDVMVPDIVAGVDAYSTVTAWVMDCNARAQGLVRVTAYKDHCGEGPELITETQHAPDLRPIIPGSAYGVAFEATHALTFKLDHSLGADQDSCGRTACLRRKGPWTGRNIRMTERS